MEKLWEYKNKIHDKKGYLEIWIDNENVDFTLQP